MSEVNILENSKNFDSETFYGLLDQIKHTNFRLFIENRIQYIEDFNELVHFTNFCTKLPGHLNRIAIEKKYAAFHKKSENSILSINYTAKVMLSKLQLKNSRNCYLTDIILENLYLLKEAKFVKKLTISNSKIETTVIDYMKIDVMFAPYHLLFLLENSALDETENFIKKYVADYSEAEMPIASLNDQEYLLDKFIEHDKRARGVIKKIIFSLQKHFSYKLDSVGEYCTRSHLYFNSKIKSTMTTDEWKKFMENEINLFILMLDRNVKISDEENFLKFFNNHLNDYLERDQYQINCFVFQQIKIIFQHSKIISSITQLNSKSRLIISRRNNEYYLMRNKCKNIK